ncbi:hypothetical protein [Streptomyces sp. SCA2-2]|uniref:hypothetical protein n=1 Tax=Streptomyces sp. SCA2-2 TaxID=1563677 RepID=UPI00101ED8E7|nr:hypothetical protein [Streptomyces sp. SCA2-2]RZE95673.1 hypothetical protein C0L86_19505 [Streptomyces sp. SCA2-2]
MAGREAGNTADDTSGAGATPAPGHRTDEVPSPVPHQPGSPEDKAAPAGGEPGGEAEQADAPHPHTCACPVCPRGTRAAHREAQAAFRARRDALAAGEGLPAAVSYSAGASRQWISDELTQAAREVGARARAEAEGWYVLLWRRTLYVVWGTVAALLLGQVVTAFAAGWTAARTAGLLAALLGGGLLTGAAHLHGRRGGVLAPVIGEDNRLSTSRAVAALWVLLTAYAVLVLAGRLAFASGDGERDTLIAGLDLARGAGLVTVLAVTCAVAVVVRRVVAVRVQGQRLQKAQAPRPRAADLLTDDSGRAHFADTQYVLVSAVAVVYALVRLARRPDQLPDLPWGLALLVLVSAATYLASKYAEGSRPVIHAVVRSREAGDLDGPIRTGDDIEIRGAGFLPPSARTPDRLARMVVRIGAVHVHVPLVPVPGGFTNPSDTTLIVPVPVEVEPGKAEVQLVSAAGVETNKVTIEVGD